MTGGSIHDNTANSNGGGVYVNGGTFIMNGGSIYNNASPNGGGVYVNSGTVTITSGIIENNEASINGGGLAIGGTGSFTMDGGSINKNISVNGNGGGIYIESGNINYIEETIPLGTGGGLYLLRDFIKSEFFLINCDILIDANYSEILNYHKKKNNFITVVVAQ